MPWLNDPEGVVGEHGDVFWFTKKGMFGYPYKPEFKEGKIYRLRVRPSNFRAWASYRYFYLEEVLEKEVDLRGDSSLYTKALEDYYKNYETKTQEISVILRKDVDYSDMASGRPYGISHIARSFNVARYADSGKASMTSGILEIPYDNKNFSSNLKLKLKAGKVIRILVRKSISDDSDNTYMLEKVLATDVKDDELKKLQEYALTPTKWHIEGEDDFDIKDGEATGIILWDPEDSNTEVGVSLECDPDNMRTATLATEHFMKILGDKKAFEEAVYAVVADDTADDDGMIRTWEADWGDKEEEETILTKDAFKKRLGIISIMLSSDGSGSVLVSLDEMFTDHAYNVDIIADGVYEAHGLIG